MGSMRGGHTEATAFSGCAISKIVATCRGMPVHLPRISRKADDNTPLVARQYSHVMTIRSIKSSHINA